MKSNATQIAEYKKTIDQIIASTTHDVDDEKVRNRIATSMSRAISMSKMTGDGSVRQPRQTTLYRFANLLRDSTSFDQLDAKCKKAFNERYDCRAWKLLDKFDLDWDVHFNIPESPKEKKAREVKEKAQLIEDERRRQAEIEEKSLSAEASSTVDNILTKEEAQAEGLLPEANPTPKEKAKDVQTFEVIIEVLVKDAEKKIEKKLEKEIEGLKDIIRHHQHRDDNKVVVVTEV